jgi:DNA polymerase III epsilon subunit-like protein
MLSRSMTDLLQELEVLALDGQASGSTPAYGDLLELGWAPCTAAGLAGPVRSRWIVPRTSRPIPWPVRELTGWSEACVADAVDERHAWAELRADLARPGGPATPAGAPTVIHFAQFELRFLHDLSRRIDGSDHLPLDVICLHAIAARLFPDLPRRNIRALAGYLGHSPDLARRAAGHVEASAFIWRALLPLLEAASVRTWSALKRWLDEPAPRARRAKPVYPLPADRRRALPDRPGVYRFLRRSGDVLYVGKAASLRKRVAGHFTGRGAAGERGLELLTQVSDVVPTETASLVEAALLETDEIKRLDPPYNVQLRAAGRQAWFASRDLSHAAPAPDAAHRVGPLPSERALAPLAALIALCEGAVASPELRAAAVAVPTDFAPPAALFDDGLRAFVEEHHLGGGDEPAAARLARASRALFLLRGRADADADAETGAGPADWDLARVRRRLERSLVQTGLVVRRTRFLCLLADATVAFRERDMPGARALVIGAGEVRERHDLDEVMAIARWPARAPRPRHDRQACFDAAAYDRLRVLVTELRRVQDEGGQTALRVGAHTLPPERLARLMLAL